MDYSGMIRAPEMEQGYLFRTAQGLFIVVDIRYEKNGDVEKYLVHHIVEANVIPIKKEQIQQAFNNNEINF